MQMLRMISGLVFLIRDSAHSGRLTRYLAAIVRYIRPTTALTRACYVGLGITLLLGALGAEWDGRRNYAIAMAAAGAVLLILRRIALVAMCGTVRWFNDLKGFGFILTDGGQNMIVHYKDIIGFGPWFREGAPVAFKTRGDVGTRTRRTSLGGTDRDVLFGRCLQVASIHDWAWPTWAERAAGCPAPDTLVQNDRNDGAQMPSDLLKAGWTRKGVAANGRGEPTLSDDPAAVAWSLCGAVNAVYEANSPLWKSYMAALRAQVGHNIVRWNGDSARTQDEVITVALDAEKIVKAPK